ncbi:hypothetical protein [Labedaea rhizosphaerae]|uniref:Uncharacterized protein n=1 Tax=Labedaea rhizosphaerae TaxID=598644 RepID=A0A4R6SJT0_LABRH|nr:hypothetical protein [Labedaea rhizosphaerae]TDQ01268.1 hypothetical protein EV186_1021136 [Labedaea rhizosphaerae]
MSNEDAPIRVCARCLLALNHRTTAVGVSWEHPVDAEVGHEVVPIPPPPGWTGKCDFCSTARPTHVVPANDFLVPGVAGHSSGGNWAACGTCGELVEQAKWDELGARVAEEFERRNGWPMSRFARRHLTKLYTRLRRNITGPVRPIREVKG